MIGFRDSQSRAFEANVKLYVTPLGFDLVIVLPDIKARFAAVTMDTLLNGRTHLNVVDSRLVNGPRKKSNKGFKAH